MARGRPATPRGTYGEIRVAEVQAGKWKVDTLLRLFNGEIVRVRATGKSKTAAINKLKENCAARLGTQDTQDLATTSPISKLLEVWFDQKTDVSQQTRERYKNVIDNHLNESLGKIRLNEITPLILDDYLQKQSTGIGGNIRSVLKGAFGMATRYGLLTSNPMLSVRPPQASKKETKALDQKQIPQFREQIKKSKDQTLIDVVDLCLCTGLRAGEVLALRWEDIHLEQQSPVLVMSGTMVYTKEHGYQRQGRGKTESSLRTIQLPSVAVEILQRRHKKFGEHLPIVFPSGAGSPIWESNFNRQLRRWRGEKFDWVTIHTLRKTLATIVANELGAEKAADVLGHADSRLTEQVYIAKNRNGVPIGDVMDKVLSVIKVTE